MINQVIGVAVIIGSNYHAFRIDNEFAEILEYVDSTGIKT